MPGHSMQRCYKLHGYPPNHFKNDDKNKKIAAVLQSNDSVPEYTFDDQGRMVIAADQTQHIMHMLIQHKPVSDSTVGQSSSSANVGKFANVAGKFCLLSSNLNSWIIDNGATDHISHDKSLFLTWNSFIGDDNFITIPDGKQVHITHKGDVQLTEHIILKDVLYVEDFKFNLISIPKLCLDLNCTASFTNDTCIIQSSSMQPQVLGKLKKGLYHLEDVETRKSVSVQSGNKVAAVSSASEQTINNTKLWHLRMGHLPVEQLEYVSSFPFDNNKPCLGDIFCQICPAARQSRKSFHSSSIKTTVPFQLLHLDIWGPYKEVTHNGCRIFLTIVDDYTRMS